MFSIKKGVVGAASLGLVAAGTIATVALTGPASGAAPRAVPAAPAPKAAISVNPHADLVARGAAVGVGMSVTCDAPSVTPGFNLSQYVSVQISEVVAGNVVQTGYGSVPTFTCDGSAHDTTVYVVPSLNGGPLGGGGAVRPFAAGSAFAAAQLSVCSLPGIILPPLAPFATPTVPPSPIPLPTPGGLPVCESASANQVITITGEG